MPPEDTQPVVTNEVLAERIHNFMKNFEEFKIQNSNENNKIIEQTTKTNGSVANLKTKWAYLTGATAVLTSLVLPILFMLIGQYMSKK